MGIVTENANIVIDGVETEATVYYIASDDGGGYPIGNSKEEALSFCLKSLEGAQNVLDTTEEVTYEENGVEVSNHDQLKENVTVWQARVDELK